MYGSATKSQKTKRAAIATNAPAIPKRALITGFMWVSPVNRYLHWTQS